MAERMCDVPVVAIEQLTLMAVHAHPDDECILAHYALQGVRTIVFTCTDGESVMAR